MKTSDFDYFLPKERIAQFPLASRTHSRMMLVNRLTGSIEHAHFTDIQDHITPKDMLVLNDTKVIPSRFFSDDGKIELLRTESHEPTLWECLVRPGKKMKIGRSLTLDGCQGEVVSILENGNRLIRWNQTPSSKAGQLALPHYMERANQESDYSRYQTVFAKKEGAIAAPTAGLHFSQALLATLPHTYLTLHVGVGTFRPVKVEDFRQHPMHEERFSLSQDSVHAIEESKQQGGKTIAVGTTCTRVLETLAQRRGHLYATHNDATDIFIYPPYSFHIVDALLTNFHLPKSTLMMLVSAFSSREIISEAYAKAIEAGYRFYSYGDCMLLY